MILMIDNYDSFTWNLVQYLGELGAAVKVFRNDEIKAADIAALKPEGIVISPGPCTPQEAGISLAAIREFAGKVPILGVCLGHQAIGQAFGGEVVHASRVVHGKTSAISHAGRGLFRGLPSPFMATRYHSLAIRRASLPACLEITAESEDGEIMGVRHRDLDVQVKKETIGEITAAAQVMRELATKVTVKDPDGLVDIVGTGGDGAHTFNISTASMFVCAAAGARVAKHGNRAVSSQSGSADVLEALGANISLKPEQVGRCIDEVGVGFMFAPAHHAAMKHAAPVRRELGVRTLFNILGPLTNPAGAPNQVMGVFHPDLVGIQVRVLQRLGARHAMTVYGLEGLDEISVSGQTMIGKLQNGKILEYMIHPEKFGLPVHDPRALRVATVEESRNVVVGALENKAGAARDIVALNAGAAIYVAGRAASLEDGVEKAFDLIKGGAARAKLDAFVKFTQQLARG